MPLVITRGGQPASASEAILRGIAPNGGLYVPECFPHVSLNVLADMASMNYKQRAVRIIGALLDDYTPEEVAEAVERAYGSGRFSHPDVAPLKKIESSDYVLELFHGPTLAFKDMALQLLPHLLTLAAR
ncbi:MAG TPA: threonine synthase, partial [Clostridia bacterium]|nr:threonine synthase [Clostridia bacterium]